MLTGSDCGGAGWVVPGRDADLVVLAADPLDSVSGLHALDGVVRAGRWYPPAALRGMRESVARDRSAR
jgi:imidazolonepropionase-like amidohydrolase